MMYMATKRCSQPKAEAQSMITFSSNMTNYIDSRFKIQYIVYFLHQGYQNFMGRCRIKKLSHYCRVGTDFWGHWNGENGSRAIQEKPGTCIRFAKIHQTFNLVHKPLQRQKNFVTPQNTGLFSSDLQPITQPDSRTLSVCPTGGLKNRVQTPYLDSCTKKEKTIRTN